MATINCTVDVPSRTLLIEDTTSAVSWALADSHFITTVTDPLGDVIHSNTNKATPDFEPSASTSIAFAATSAAVSVADDTMTVVGHGLYTGAPISFYGASGGTITGVTDKTIYFAVVEDADTIKIATTRANAKAGTTIDLTAVSGSGTMTMVYRNFSLDLPVTSDDVIVTGQYTVAVTIFDGATPATEDSCTQYFTYTHESPTISLTNSYSIINPVHLTSVDATTYTSGGVTPDITRQFTLYYPNSLGSYTVETATLTTSGFYGGAPATHGVRLISTLDYTFTTASYSGGASTYWYLTDIVQGDDEIAVYSDVSGCDIYCVLKCLNEKVVEARGTKDYDRMYERFMRASTLALIIERAYECNKGVDVEEYRRQFDIITNCNCSGCGDTEPTQVVGIGVTPSVTKKQFVTLTSNVTNYTFSALAGKSYTNGDFVPIADGDDIEAVGGYSITFNAVSGNIAYGLTIPSGTIIGWRLVR